MALNIPMPESPGKSLLQGLETGSTLMSRIMNARLEKERLKQNQAQFLEDLALRKQVQDRANSLLPYMIQQYQDTHKTAASEADIKDMYRNLIKNALGSESGLPAPAMPSPSGMGIPSPNAPGMTGAGADSGMAFDAQGNNVVASPEQVAAIAEQAAQASPQNQMPPPPIGSQSTMPAGVAPGGQQPMVPPGAAQIGTPMPPDLGAMEQEHELRPGNPRLAKLDQVAGLVPGIPKPAQHITNGIVYTTYPSGRMTAQRVPGMKTVSQETPEERKNREIETKSGIEDAKAASKLQSSGRELQSLVNRAQKVEKLLDENPNLTGLRQGTLASLNLSQSKKLAEFDQTTRKLQADMGRYGSQRGGAQALKWAEKSKPGAFKTVDYNKGMIKSILDDAKADYDDLAQEYKSRTGKDYPIKFPEMKKPEINKSHVTEENIRHTMEQTGLTRPEVMARLKKKGLV